jgi:hypothetical protein
LELLYEKLEARVGIGVDVEEQTVESQKKKVTQRYH